MTKTKKMTTITDATTDSKSTSGFYSSAARKLGGRATAIAALDALEADLQILLADLAERIPTIDAILAEQEAGTFRGRPLSSLEGAFSIIHLSKVVCDLRRLRVACRANLLACAARRRELQL